MSGLWVIWDFNGTILDDVRTGIESINRLLRRRGLPTIDSVEEYHSRFRFPIIDYYAGLGFDFTKEPYSEVAVEWVAEYDSLVPDAGLCPGVREAIDLIAGERLAGGAGSETNGSHRGSCGPGDRRLAGGAGSETNGSHRGSCGPGDRRLAGQIVLSATEQNMLLRQISELGLDGVFDEVLGMDNIEAHSKLPAALRFKERHPDARLVVIGDTTHDFEVARAIGAECILVASGHQSRATLEKCGVPVADNAIEAAEMIVKGIYGRQNN